MSSAANRWFLRPEERGNPDTDIDRRRGCSWSEGNRVEALVDGASYFGRLHDAFGRLDADDWVHFTDWRGDCDELLDGPGSEIGRVLTDLIGRGVDVRGLLWRSHPARLHFSAEQNLDLARDVNAAGGRALLDQRVHTGGSHHQKLVLIRHPGREDEDLAFVGGIDLCHGRRDDSGHMGDPQGIAIGPQYGDRPPWHDVQLELRGPVLGDLAWTFRERWEDPTPLDHGGPFRMAYARLAGQPRHADPLPPMREDPGRTGDCAVQVLRTYPATRHPYPFARRGERSIARAYIKAFRQAKSYIYLEDQYFWSERVAGFLADALRRNPRLVLVVVVPRYPYHDGPVTGPPSRVGQASAMRVLRDAGGERVHVFDLENEQGRPIYVHSKVCIIDDVWAIVGSDNMNLRSWTHDSELACAVVDDALDPREPADPGGGGDGARVFARELRLRLWQEHLGLESGDVLVDPVSGVEAWREAATKLQDWHSNGKAGRRPPGRVTAHRPAEVGTRAAPWATLAYHTLVDPDGRPPDLRSRRSF